jgi:hypothetical protein
MAETSKVPGLSGEQQQGQADPSGLGIYDVLTNPDHPGFLNLGRLLWILVATPWDWVDRRVETVSLVGERRFRRHMSIDCRIPRVVTDLADELGFDRFLVPLRLLAERPLLSFDLQLGTEPVPFLTSPHSVMAEKAVLRAAVEHLERPLTPEVVAALDEVARSGQTGAAARALDLLDIAETPRLADSGTATPEGLVNWAITTLDHNLLLLADVPLDAVRNRALFKITEELGPEGSGPLSLRSEIAWQPLSFVFGVSELLRNSSYHFQFVAPDGLVVAGGDLLAVDVKGTAPRADRPSDGHPSHGISASFGHVATHGQVLGVSVHLDEVPEADDYLVRVLLRPSPDGLLRASALSSCFTTLLLVLAVVFAGSIDNTRLESSAALMLVLPGVVSSLWLRPGEHSLVSRALRGTRTLLLASVVTVYTAAAAVLVVGAVPDRLRLVWSVLAAVSVVPAAALVRALRRCRSFPL